MPALLGIESTEKRVKRHTVGVYLGVCKLYKEPYLTENSILIVGVRIPLPQRFVLGHPATSKEIQICRANVNEYEALARHSQVGSKG